MILRRDPGRAASLLQQLFIGAKSAEKARRVRGEEDDEELSSMRIPFRSSLRERTVGRTPRVHCAP